LYISSCELFIGCPPDTLIRVKLINLTPIGPPPPACFISLYGATPLYYNNCPLEAEEVNPNDVPGGPEIERGGL